MSDTRRQYRAIRDGLMQALHHPTGHHASHMDTLSLLMCGILGAMHSHLPRIASQSTAFGRLRSRLVQRFRTWYRHHVVTIRECYNPLITTLLVGIAAPNAAVRVVPYGSAVGRNCVALVANVVYRGRSIPIAWTVVRGKKGRLPQWIHVELLRRVRRLLPRWTKIIILGDGEFNDQQFLQTISAYRWSFVCRTSNNMVVWHIGTTDVLCRYARATRPSRGMEIDPDDEATI